MHCGKKVGRNDFTLIVHDPQGHLRQREHAVHKIGDFIGTSHSLGSLFAHEQSSCHLRNADRVGSSGCIVLQALQSNHMFLPGTIGHELPSSHNIGFVSDVAVLTPANEADSH